MAMSDPQPQEAMPEEGKPHVPHGKEKRRQADLQESAPLPQRPAARPREQGDGTEHRRRA
jgi:hypothetical protein